MEHHAQNLKNIGKGMGIFIQSSIGRERVPGIIVTLYLSLITCLSLELQVSLFKLHRQCKAAEVTNLAMPGLQRLQNICWLARAIN